MTKELQAWAVHVLRFALREPQVAAGGAVLQVIDTAVEGPGRFRGAVLTGDLAEASVALTQARSAHPDKAWGVAFLASVPPSRTFLLVDCMLTEQVSGRFCTELRGAGDTTEAGPLLYLGALGS
ncbi:MAG: hypothetical protein ACI9MC_002902 [Kiritimatiellia bacterium]|jgi:hypothetical protein